MKLTHICPRVPFRAVCMTEAEYKLQRVEYNLELEFLKRKINSDFSYDGWDITIGVGIGFLLGYIVKDVLD